MCRATQEIGLGSVVAAGSRRLPAPAGHTFGVARWQSGLCEVHLTVQAPAPAPAPALAPAPAPAPSTTFSNVRHQYKRMSGCTHAQHPASLPAGAASASFNHSHRTFAAATLSVELPEGEEERQCNMM